MLGGGPDRSRLGSLAGSALRVAPRGDTPSGRRKDSTLSTATQSDAPLRATGPRRRFRDPWPWVVGVVAVTVYSLPGLNGELTRDLAVYSYAGQQVVEGQPPYLGILNRAGPLAHLIPALGVGVARVTGADDLFVLRLSFLLLAALSVVVAYLAGRDMFRLRAAGLAAAAAMISFQGFLQLAANGPREKTPMVLLLLLALWALAHRRWTLAGVAVSLATLTLQLAFIVAVPALLVVALLQPHGRRGALLRVVAGGLVPLALAVAGFAAVGALREFVDAFVVINATYTVADPFVVAEHWPVISAGFGVSLWFLLAGLAAVLVLAPRVLSARRRQVDPSVADVAGLAAATVSGLVWSLRDFDSYPDLLPLLPMAALGVAAALAEVARRGPRALTVAVTAGWCVVAVVLAVSAAVALRDDSLLDQRRAVAAMFDRLPADATVMSLNAPQPLVLTGRRNPTRHQMLGSGLDDYIDDTWPGGFEGFVDWNKQQAPTLIAVGPSGVARTAARFRPEYQVIGPAGGWLWLGNRSLGGAKLAELREVSQRLHDRAVGEAGEVP